METLNLPLPLLLEEAAIAAALAFFHLEGGDIEAYIQASELQARLQLQIDQAIVLEV